jgi:hypothetical protein
MRDRRSLFEASARQEDIADVELVQIAELKLSGEADVVIVLEATKGLLDTDPGKRKFTLEPALGEHPDTPGVTTVTVDRAEQTFGRLPYISDGPRAWFTGLGRRHLGNALSAARDRAVICTRQGSDARPSRTVVELRDRLGLQTNTSTTDRTDDDSTGDEVQNRIESLRRHLHPEVEPVGGDDATTVAEHLQADIREGDLSDVQIGTVLRLIAQYRQTTSGTDRSADL